MTTKAIVKGLTDKLKIAAIDARDLPKGEQPKDDAVRALETAHETWRRGKILRMELQSNGRAGFDLAFMRG